MQYNPLVQLPAAGVNSKSASGIAARELRGAAADQLSVILPWKDDG